MQFRLTCQQFVEVGVRLCKSHVDLVLFLEHVHDRLHTFFSTLAHPQEHNLEFFVIKRQKDDILRVLNPKKCRADDVQDKIVQLLRLPLELDIREYTKALSCCNSLELSDYVMEQARYREWRLFFAAYSGLTISSTP